jgi:16S rRNA (guanine527-N7)-methyltransferase
MTNDISVPFEVSPIIDQFLSRERLDRYFALLMVENARVNLVSRETSRESFDRMVAESLLPLTQIKDSVSGYLDIGSGGGLPSIPLLLSGRISRPTVLCERTQKKAAALGTILEGLELKAEILPSQFLDLKLTRRFDLITLRYVKLDIKLLERITPLLSSSGTFVYYSEPEFPHIKCRVERFKFTDPADSVTKSFTLFRRS